MTVYTQNPPHIRSRESNASLMLSVIVAMLPLYAIATYFYGPRAVLLGLTGALSAGVTDALCMYLGGRVPNLRDFSSIVTGLMIPLLLPATVRYNIVIVAVLFGIAVAKQPFGGVGENIFNPAAAGMAFAIVCWPADVFSYPVPFERIPLFLTADTVFRVGTSPAKALALGGLPANTLIDTLMGNVPGPMGCTSVLVLFTCLLFLAVRRAVHVRATLAFLAGAAALAVLTPRAGGRAALYEMMCGMLPFAAVFMINDPVTSPKRSLPMLVYGATTGVISILFRHLGSYEESVIFAILVMNSAVWMLDLWGEHLARERRREKHDAGTRAGVPAASRKNVRHSQK